MRALDTWRAAAATSAPIATVPAPSSGRLASLRRRYHELGAGNPYAADELAELSVRLDALEAQRTDLETAIRSTRELIARLEGLITEQFRTTFAALEDAFARRFKQLFDGGEAQLSLTAPEDLASTGVEIDRSTAGQEAPAPGDALGRRAVADGRGAAARDARGASGAVLRPRRGGRRPR